MNEKSIKEFYIYLQSQQTAQKFLSKCYKKINVVNAEAKSYENCNTFMYYLEHGQQFYDSGKNSKSLLQPILYFYGMIHIIKACLLTKRPNYPESTTMLAHGVSARKRKKKNYTFMQDEIKIQINGLFPYFSEHLFAIKSFPFEKSKMHDLLALIPEMSPLFNFQGHKKMAVIGSIGSRFLQFPKHLLDSYHLTERAFVHRIQTYLPKILHTKCDNSKIHIELTTPLSTSYGPFFFHGTDETIYFPISRDHFVRVPEVMTHYLLLYNLSMLSRYETEWWGDLLATKPDADYPFIVQFLQSTSEKVPLLLGQDLYQTYLDIR